MRRALVVVDEELVLVLVLVKLVVEVVRLPTDTTHVMSCKCSSRCVSKTMRAMGSAFVVVILNHFASGQCTPLGPQRSKPICPTSLDVVTVVAVDDVLVHVVFLWGPGIKWECAQNLRGTGTQRLTFVC